MDRLAWTAENGTGATFERRYRADAQILLLGIPILRREGVGGGSVRWHEFESEGAARLLEFNGYSLPDRAAGLNRLGFIRELSRGSECVYFGLMTASPEESAEEARKALHSDAKEHAYTAIEGRMAAGQFETTIAHFPAPAALTGARTAELVPRAERALALEKTSATSDRAPTASKPFLQTLADLLTRPDGKNGRFIYSGRPYLLQLARATDAKATAYFRERKMIAAPVEAIRVSGKLRREAGGKETEFRLWVPGGGERPLPLRIEYQAKSYLRLIFEAA
jgi:hypothetical protein